MDNYAPEHKDALDALLLVIPGVKATRAFGYPTYKVNGRMFAFVGGKGMSLKLPLKRVADVIAAHDDIHPFEVAEGVVWREWISIQPADPAAYETYLPLFEESIGYIAGG